VRGWAVLGFALLLAGCSALEIVNALAPTAGLEIHRGIAYGVHDRNGLDVYAPAERTGKVPAVVFYYGGAWDSGAKSEYLFAAQALASRGFVVVVPDYRLYPEVVFPAFLEDAAAAAAWAHRNVARYGGDPDRLYLMGHSAGAHLAAMVALDPRFLARQGLKPDVLAGFIGLAGPYDFLPLKSETLKAIFTTPEGLERTQPIRFVTAGSPRAWLGTGDKDVTVSPGNTKRLAARLREAGVEVTERHYESLDHVSVIGALALPFRPFEPVLDDIERFIRNAAAASGSEPARGGR
jgi:acetyl esterase/lipase